MLVRSASGPDAVVRPGSERRQSYRFACSPQTASLQLRDESQVPILDLGAWGAQVRCDVRIDRVLLSQCLLRLRDGVAVACSAQPVGRSFAEDGSVRLGLQFDRLTPRARRTLSRHLVEAQCASQSAYARFFQPPGGVVETGASRFLKLLRLYALSRCETLRVYEGEVLLDRRVAVRSVGTSTAVGVELGQGPDLLQHGRRYGFVACGEGSVVAFETVVERDGEGGVVLQVPESFVQSGFRSSPRGTPRGAERPRAVLGHEVLHFQPRYIDEVSARGFSVRVNLEDEPIWPGARLDDVTLDLDGHRVRASAVVRSVLPSANGRDARCGVELTGFASARDDKRWKRAAFDWLHPSLKSGSRACPDNAWNVLESSAYVSEWTDGAEQKRVRKAYVSAWGERRGTTGRLLLLEGPKGVAATAAGTWLYPRTWMFHHFGVDQRLRLGQRSFLSYSRELYTGALYEYGHMAGLDYFTLYVERGKRWNDLMYGDFCARHTGDPRLMYRANEVYRCDTAAVGLPDLDPRVREACDDDRAVLNRHLAATRSPLELDSMAWRPEFFEPGALQARFAPIGFERDRRVFVYDGGHGPSWALVCETGDEGVNVFGLLNTCWLFPLRAVTRADARPALLARALHFYRQCGKRHVVLFEPEGGQAADARALGFKHVSGGMHWLAHRDVMPAWLTHVRDVLAVSSSRVRDRRVA